MIAGPKPRYRWTSKRDKRRQFADRKEKAEPTSAKMLKSAELWLIEHPAICISGAVLLGVTVGWLIKRR